VIRDPWATRLVCLSFLALSGCRVVSFAKVVLPTEGPTYLVECNYEFANCAKRATKQCEGGFEQLTRKNCPRCGTLVPPNPQKNASVQMPGYRGQLYFRCM
jgi:hypothetical protein